eukprot:3734589-Lingulodinium_polyedra.AAC.1
MAGASADPAEREAPGVTAALAAAARLDAGNALRRPHNPSLLNMRNVCMQRTQRNAAQRNVMYTT